MATLILVALAAVFEAATWKIAFHDSRGAFWNLGPFWRMDESWKRKWKNGDPASGPAFPGSTTVFVWVTDGFHFMQAISFFFFFLAIICYTPNGFFIPEFFQWTAGEVFGISTAGEELGISTAGKVLRFLTAGEVLGISMVQIYDFLIFRISFGVIFEYFYSSVYEKNTRSYNIACRIAAPFIKAGKKIKSFILKHIKRIRSNKEPSKHKF